MISYDPIDAYDRHCEYEHRVLVGKQAVADEMYNLKHDALERISLVVHPEYELEFVKLLTVGLSEKLPEAESLAKKIGLGQGHILAIEGDEDEMGRYLYKRWFRSEDYF